MNIYVNASSESTIDLNLYGPGRGEYSEYDSPSISYEDEEFLYSAAYSIFEEVADNGNGHANEFNYLLVDGCSEVDGETYYYDIDVADILSDIENLRLKLRDYDKAEKFWYEKLLPKYVEYYKSMECC